MPFKNKANIFLFLNFKTSCHNCAKPGLNRVKLGLEAYCLKIFRNRSKSKCKADLRYMCVCIFPGKKLSAQNSTFEKNITIGSFKEGKVELDLL